MESSPVCPSDDNLDQREVLGYTRIHVVLVVPQKVNIILQAILVEVLKCEIKELQSSLSFVIPHLNQVVSECMILLEG